MNDFNPGDGWREVTDPIERLERPRVTCEDENGKTRYWVREEPVPRLPSAPYTVIRVTWKDDHSHGTMLPTLWSSNGNAWADNDGQWRYATDLIPLITSFEVLSEPRAVTAKQEGEAHNIGYKTGTEDVLNRLREFAGFEPYFEKLEVVAREFGAES